MAKIGKIIGPPGCLSGETELMFCRKLGNKKSKKKSTLADAYYKFNNIPREKSGWHQSRSGKNYLWDSTIDTYTLAYTGESITHHRIEAIVDSGRKPTYTITTDGGLMLRCTAEHPFLTIKDEKEQFVQLQNLNLGDTLIVRGEKKKNGRIKRLYRKIVTGVKYHPHKWAKKIKGIDHCAVLDAKLILEAELNALSMKELIKILKTDQVRAQELRYLDPAMVIHHIDENPRNNDLANLKILTKKEHDTHHSGKSNLHFGDQKPSIDRVKSIISYGMEHTYDIIMTDPYHNYVANGFVVHNTGKTTEIMRLIEAATRKYDRDRIGAISFTKAAVETIGERIRHDNGEIPDNVRTIHGHAFKLLQVKKNQICDSTRDNKQLQGFCNEYPRWELSASRTSGDDDHFSYDVTTKSNDQVFQEMQINRHQMIPIEQWDEQPRALYRDWMNYLNENDLIDFTGILEKCYRMRLAPQVDVLFVDEAQDLTALQYVLTSMWAEKTENTLFVGDGDQCHPAGTMLFTRNRGSVAIQDLDPEKDCLLTYDMGSSAFVKSKSWQISQRNFDGMMVTINERLKATYNHRFIAKWNEKAVGAKGVYLMRKGNKWRIGISDIIRKKAQGICGIRQRAMQEKADDVWLLAIPYDYTNAIMLEEKLSIRYGISQMVFYAPKQGALLKMSQEELDAYHNEISLTARPYDLLRDLGFSYEYPYWQLTNGKSKKLGRRTYHEVRAINLFAEYMDVPTFNPSDTYDGDASTCYGWRQKRYGYLIHGIKHGTETIKSITKENMSCLVYSLDVKPHPTYIAEGIIVHNSIFRWAGVAPEVFMNIEHSWFKLLDQSYRVPPNILNYAQEIIRNVKTREDITYKPFTENGDGTVLNCLEPDLSLPGTHMILTRCNYQVNKWINWLKGHGQIWHNPYRTEDHTWNPTLSNAWLSYSIFYELQHGKSVSGAALKKMVANMLTTNLIKWGVAAKIEKWKDAELYQKYNLLDLAQLGFTLPFVQGRIPFADWINRKTRITDHLQELFTPEKPRFVVGTVHSVKGGESDHVWIDSESTRTICNQVNNDIGHAHDDEARLYYVAATRARKTLGILSTRSPLRAPFIC